jgi:hypothetical protein
MVKLLVTMPAGTEIVTAALPPLLTVKVAGLVRSVVTKTTSASRSLPLGGPRGSPEQVTSHGVGRYQYTNWSAVTVGALAPAL